MLFITHQLPKGLMVDEAVLLGKENESTNVMEINNNEIQRQE